MTTFTLQDLTPNQQDNEALQSMAKLGGGVDVLLDGLVGKTEEARHEAMHKMVKVVLEHEAQHAPDPQPTLESIINSICTQLQLLTTVISQAKAQPEGNQSLQDCVALTLQQADWFKSMVGTYVDEYDFESHVHEAVSDRVETEVDNYFDQRFDPTDHFDFGDAVADRVDEMLDDVVRERVQDSLEEVVAEKLSEASISISF